MKRKSFWIILGIFPYFLHGQESVNADILRILKGSTAEYSNLTEDSLYQKLALWMEVQNESFRNTDRYLSEAVSQIRHLNDKVHQLEQAGLQQEQNQLALYQSNYETALLNLVSMEREIRPLHLFNATREFVNALSHVSNPMHYPGYRQWYEKFQEYMDKNKAKDPAITVLQQLMLLTGDVSKGIITGGPVTEPLFSAMTGFIRSLGGGSKKQLREESERMFLLTATLAQFAYEQQIIEHEWKSISAQMAGLQQQYEMLLEDNLRLAGISYTDFSYAYAKENDALRRHEYQQKLREKAMFAVTEQKRMYPDAWKETIYYRMADIQALKLRFGSVTARIKENIGRYHVLLAKYKSDTLIGPMIASAELHLKEVSQIFENAFEPEQYMTAAGRMYRVY
jgi:hypothetical protein